jgi:ATP-dependent DNA ligase
VESRVGGVTAIRALNASGCKLGLEGVVAKKLRSRYQPGERGWIKVKNRTTGGAMGTRRGGAVARERNHALHLREG